MFEAPINEATRNAYHRAHQERTAAFRQFWKFVTRKG